MAIFLCECLQWLQAWLYPTFQHKNVLKLWIPVIYYRQLTQIDPRYIISEDPKTYLHSIYKCILLAPSSGYDQIETLLCFHEEVPFGKKIYHQNALIITKSMKLSKCTLQKIQWPSQKTSFKKIKMILYILIYWRDVFNSNHPI